MNVLVERPPFQARSGCRQYCLHNHGRGGTARRSVAYLRVRRQACVLCEVRPATRRGEHVLPQWYLRDRGHGPGPHPWSRNGEPILDREGRPIALSQRVRVLLPACDLCNIGGEAGPQ